MVKLWKLAVALKLSPTQEKVHQSIFLILDDEKLTQCIDMVAGSNSHKLSCPPTASHATPCICPHKSPSASTSEDIKDDVDAWNEMEVDGEDSESDSEYLQMQADIAKETSVSEALLEIARNTYHSTVQIQNHELIKR